MEKFIADHTKLSKIYPQVGRGNDGDLHVLVLFGGMSCEREPSLMSGQNILESLADSNYCITPVDMGVDVAEVIARLKPDVVFNALHGTYGEDGCIQGLLEILGIPYTNSKVLASAIALDKLYSQQIFALGGIKCPKRVIISRGDDLKIEPIKRPYVIKPIDQGSSIGVEVILEGDDYNLGEYSFSYGDKAIIEEYICGQEIQVAVLKGKAIGTLELICLQGKRFNDYECKYKAGYSKHISPANIPKSAQENVMKMAEEAHKLIGCKGLTRDEFIYNAQEDQAYFLEINTHPGLTLFSSAPDILKNNGISIQDLFKTLIDEALYESKK